MTGDALRVCPFSILPCYWPWPVPPRTDHPLLHLSPWEQVGQSMLLESHHPLRQAYGDWCGGLLLFLHECLSLAWADLWPPRWRGSCQVQTQVELAFPGYNSMIVATWLDPPCKLTQSLEFDAGEGQELTLHVGHILEWLLFFDSLPLLLVLPKIVEELGLQLIPFLLLVGGVVVLVEGSEDVAQVLPPPCTPVVSDVPQRVSRGGLLSAARLWRGLSMGGGWGNITRHPNGVSTLLLRLWVTGLPHGGPLLSSPGMADRPIVIISASGSLSPTYIGVPTVSGCRLAG